MATSKRLVGQPILAAAALSGGFSRARANLGASSGFSTVSPSTSECRRTERQGRKPTTDVETLRALQESRLKGGCSQDWLPHMERPSQQARRFVVRGSALLTVMWLSAALAAIGFSLASTVRGETERTSTELDGLRSYYLACGGVERASLELLWSVSNPNQRLIPRGSTTVNYPFETGIVHVEFLPEAGKLDVNRIPVIELDRLLVALGADPQRASEIAMNVVAWRQPASQNGGMAVPIDPFSSSFQVPHASFQGIEEMLAVKGVTPELFFGTYVLAPDYAPADAPRLQARPGLVDCLSVFGSTTTVDVNTAQPAVFAAVGLSPDAIGLILQRRRLKPFTADDINNVLSASGVPTDRLRVEGNSIVTIRATARLRLPNGQLSDLRRTVAAMVKYMPQGYDSPIHILRWYDTAFADNAFPDPALPPQGWNN